MLSERIRPGVEAAPWVVEEVKRLELALALARGNNSSDAPSEASLPDTACPAIEADPYRAQVTRLLRMEHDFPHLMAFHRKHSLGPMMPPHCLICGRMTLPAELEASCSVAFQHPELPGVVVCKQCHTAAVAAANPVQDAQS